MNYSSRELTLIGLLASVNGLLEISMGTIFHLVDIPVAGTVMVIINLTIYFIGRRLVPRMGVVFAMGFITAVLKLLYAGGKKFTPAAAILMEALILEVILDFFSLKKITAIISGAVLNIFTFLYPFIAYAVIGGAFALDNLGRLIGADGRNIPVKEGTVLILFVYVLTGCLWGMIAWHISTLCKDYYEICFGLKKPIQREA